MSAKGKPTAIIIDDVKSIRGMAKVMLDVVGCEVVGEAENGQIGLSLYLEKKPDLVLLDIEMPVKDGLSTLRAIMKNNADANVVMMTTVSNVTIAESCTHAGAKDFIQKDMGPNVIKDKLESIVNQLFKN